ncbi:MAG TPA: hypothetical protein PKN62_00490 [bacterium]|nr:hypothetical protein [bacterium]
MKLNLEANKIEVNPIQFMRQAGYGYLQSPDGGSFIRTFGRSPYPRFHVYLEDRGEVTVINLHLDQKQPGYGGQARHNGEYDGPTVAAEINRLDQLKNNLVRQGSSFDNDQSDNQQKGSWLSRLFS